VSQTHESAHIDQYAKLELEALYELVSDSKNRRMTVALLFREFLDHVHVIPVHSRKEETD